MKIAPYEVLRNDAKRNVRLVMDDRNVWLLVSHIRLHERRQPIDRPGSSFVVLTTEDQPGRVTLSERQPTTRTRYFRWVHTGLISLPLERSCTIPIATSYVDEHGVRPAEPVAAPPNGKMISKTGKLGCPVAKKQGEAKDLWQAANTFPATSTMTALPALFPGRGVRQPKCGYCASHAHRLIT